VGVSATMNGQGTYSTMRVTICSGVRFTTWGYSLRIAVLPLTITRFGVGCSVLLGSGSRSVLHAPSAR
jgi:hypothetical protein